jgi:hypothetical protein
MHHHQLLEDKELSHSGSPVLKDASIYRRGLWFEPRVCSAPPKAISCGCIKGLTQAAKLDSGPSQKVNNDRNEENRSE